MRPFCSPTRISWGRLSPGSLWGSEAEGEAHKGQHPRLLFTSQAFKGQLGLPTSPPQLFTTALPQRMLLCPDWRRQHQRYPVESSLGQPWALQHPRGRSRSCSPPACALRKSTTPRQCEWITQGLPEPVDFLQWQPGIMDTVVNTTEEWEGLRGEELDPRRVHEHRGRAKGEG